MDNHNVVVYKTESSNVKLEVKVSDETVWLTQTQMAILFDCSTDNISLHLKNIYEEHEIDSDSTSENFSVVRLEGNRRVTRTVKHYNLDAILSVGYRVSSASYRGFIKRFRKKNVRFLKNGNRERDNSFYFVIAVTINVPPSGLRPHFASRREGPARLRGSEGQKPD